MVKADTQKKKILRWLQTHKSGLTTFDGFTKFGCTKLTTRISELRADGHPITDVWEEYEDGTRFKRYFYAGGSK